MSISIHGNVEHIIFRNPENGFTIFNFTTADGDVVSKGIFPDMEEGLQFKLQGQYVNHPSHGKQFQVEHSEAVMPEEKDSILRYLSSRAIKGIGPKMAKKIVDRFKEDTFRIMGEEPERLAEIKGISLFKAQEIAESFVEKAGLRRAMIFLSKFGLGNVLSARIYKRYGEGVYKIIEENPYRMTEEVRGVGFKTADSIAVKSGIEKDSDFRIRAGIQHILKLSTGEGHTYLPERELLDRTASILTRDRAQLMEQLKQLIMERVLIRRKCRALTNTKSNIAKSQVIEDPQLPTFSEPDTEKSRMIEEEDTRIYLARFYQMELSCAKILKSLNLTEEIEENELKRDIAAIEQKSGLHLGEEQSAAVIAAVKSGVSILTGGPGTGKTTTIRVLLQYFLSKGMDVMLSAPTGRAAKRMTEATGMEAKTIHRLLEVSGGISEDEGLEEGDQLFGRNEENPLETDVVIVDEVSMVDIFLFYSLLSALSPGMRLILVGDEHQLPSVGPGAVLKDLIASKQFRVSALTQIFRQAEESDIVMNAHAILEGRPPKLDNKSRDFFFLERSDPEEIIAGIIYLVSRKLPPYVRAASQEIQVLTPMRKGPVGVEMLNKRLQEALNPPNPQKREVILGGKLFREGDKVMQTRNDYQQEWSYETQGEVLQKSGTGVYNGDIASIAAIDKINNTITVKFDDGRTALYEAVAVQNLDLAYAITIHKSQGSEYPAIILPLLRGPEHLFNRNLLYTAVTRAKKCVVAIGRRDTIFNMIGNTDEQKRYTGLQGQIEMALGGTDIGHIVPQKVPDM